MIVSYWNLKLLKVIEFCDSPFQLQIDFTNDCNWIYAFIVKLKIRNHIRLHRRNSKNLNNLHKNSLKGIRYIKLQMALQKIISVFRRAYLQATCLTGHKMIWDWSFHSGNNEILFASPGTRSCGLGLLWLWMVRETFTCSA